jgi:hypothetical protein
MIKYQLNVTRKCPSRRDFDFTIEHSEDVLKRSVVDNGIRSSARCHPSDNVVTKGFGGIGAAVSVGFHLCRLRGRIGNAFTYMALKIAGGFFVTTAHAGLGGVSVERSLVMATSQRHYIRVAGKSI